jgi:hypothetical protein
MYIEIHMLSLFFLVLQDQEFVEPTSVERLIFAVLGVLGLDIDLALVIRFFGCGVSVGGGERGSSGVEIETVFEESICNLLKFQTERLLESSGLGPESTFGRAEFKL